MDDDLDSQAMDQILRRNRYGRLGFTLADEAYVVPVNYGYDGARIYGQTVEGTKVEGMRRNPNVALLVDEIEDAARWQSVLIQGTFVELKDRAE
ncbi:MAG: pyridoxamine 5'-phosphate oxidase family protein, partial [Dehalococcoidia bacterium]